MFEKHNFIAIVKFHELIPEIQLQSLLQSQGLIETTLSQDQIKVFFFQGSYLDLYFKKAGLESEVISQYLTLIDIGLAPNSGFEHKFNSISLQGLPKNHLIIFFLLMNLTKSKM